MAAASAVGLSRDIGRDESNADFVRAVVAVVAGDGATARDAIDGVTELWSQPWADQPDWLPRRALAFAIKGDGHRLEGQTAEAVAAYDRALAGLDSIADPDAMIENRFERTEPLAEVVGRVAESR